MEFHLGQSARSNPIIVTMEMFLIVAIDRCGCVVSWTVFHALAINIDVHQIVRPVDFSYRSWGDKDLPPWPPVSRIDDYVMDTPIGILDEEVIDVANLAVARMDMIPGDRFDAAEMRIIVTPLRSGNIFVAPHGFTGR